MKRLGNGFAHLMIFFLLVIFFLPKQSLYYQAEALLKRQNVTLSGEQTDDSGMRFHIEGGTLFYGDLNVARLKEITVTPWLFYNRIAVAPFALSSQMRSFLPPEISSLDLEYSVLDPRRVYLQGSGDFGSVSGQINLFSQTVTVDLNASATLRALRPFWLREMKLQKGGIYHYETAY